MLPFSLAISPPVYSPYPSVPMVVGCAKVESCLDSPIQRVLRVKQPGVNLTTHLRLVLRLISGACHHMLSLRAGGTVLLLPLPLIRIILNSYP